MSWQKQTVSNTVKIYEAQFLVNKKIEHSNKTLYSSFEVIFLNNGVGLIFKIFLYNVFVIFWYFLHKTK